MFESVRQRLERFIERAIDSTEAVQVFSGRWWLVRLSTVYGWITGVRCWLYEKQILKQKRLPCFVISIGNIAVGGTGKTPMAIFLAEQLRQMNKTCVVVSRGYKGRYQGPALAVSDGTRLLSDAVQAGDEPLMMARLKQFPVVVGKNRYTAGKLALDLFSPDVLILDDGFQHLGLGRDLDLLLLDGTAPLGNSRLLPAGRLRESFDTAVKRADAVIFTRCDDQSQSRNASHFGCLDVKRFRTQMPSFRTFHQPMVCTVITQEKQTGPVPIETFAGRTALLFSGIAGNTGFYQTVARYGIKVKDHLEFKDHYRYKGSDFDRINACAGKIGVDLIMTTQKDWAKLSDGIQWASDLVVIGIQIQFEQPDRFQSFLTAKMNSS